ncbi:MAG: hypothetical protein WB807_07980 [Candidatus Dormiibacterota bacterium]
MENPPSGPGQTSVSADAGVPVPVRHRPFWGLPVVVIAVVAIVALFVVGFTGLFANPVKSVNPDGTATLSGSFEPYQCSRVSCDGYISAGARSVFVVFPRGCTPPVRGGTIRVAGKPAPDLGNASYRATVCS